MDLRRQLSPHKAAVKPLSDHYCACAPHQSHPSPDMAGRKVCAAALGLLTLLTNTHTQRHTLTFLEGPSFPLNPQTKAIPDNNVVISHGTDRQAGKAEGADRETSCEAPTHTHTHTHAHTSLSLQRTKHHLHTFISQPIQPNTLNTLAIPNAHALGHTFPTP